MHDEALVDDQDDSPGADFNPLNEEEEKKLTAAIGRFSESRRGDTQSCKLPKIRKATSTTKCNDCGQYGHFKSNCPIPERLLDRRSASRPSLECLLCNGNHCVRYCPSLASAKTLVRQEIERERDASKFIVPRPHTANEPSAAVKRDGTAVFLVTVEEAVSGANH